MLAQFNIDLKKRRIRGLNTRFKNENFGLKLALFANFKAKIAQNGYKKTS
jgi:hypothetical protein